MFFILEDGRALYAGKVLALVRTACETSILTEDGEPQTSFYTPGAIDRRSRKFWNDARVAWKEQQRE